MKQQELIVQMFDRAASWRENGDNRYIFLNCYAMMTENMLGALEKEQFKDNRWVERLLHHFADYYFIALDQYNCGEDCVPKVWLHAHRTSGERRLLTIQYLLLGINAHINYDLVLALSDVLTPEWDSLSEDKRRLRYLDHKQVNTIIGQTIDKVQDEVIEKRDPWMDVIDRLMGRADEWLLSRLITHWREEVWKEALTMANTRDASEKERLRLDLEARVLKRGKQILLG